MPAPWPHRFCRSEGTCCYSRMAGTHCKASIGSSVRSSTWAIWQNQHSSWIVDRKWYFPRSSWLGKKSQGRSISNPSWCSWAHHLSMRTNKKNWVLQHLNMYFIEVSHIDVEGFQCCLQFIYVVEDNRSFITASRKCRSLERGFFNYDCLSDPIIILPC